MHALRFVRCKSRFLGGKRIRKPVDIDGKNLDGAILKSRQHLRSAKRKGEEGLYCALMERCSDDKEVKRRRGRPATWTG